MLVEHSHGIVKNKFLFFILMGMALLPAILSSYAGLTWIQRNFVPVAVDFTVEELTLDKSGDVVISGSFVKSFDNTVCAYQSMSFYSEAESKKESRVLLRVHHEFGDVRPNPADNDRPKGFSRFWNWKIFMSEYPDQRSFFGVVRHKCLGFWPAVTPFPEIRLPYRDMSMPDSIEVIP